MKPDNIRMVLVETTHPGNIGGVARAMKNMGLDRLDLVAPRHFPHEDATARASGAADVLDRARVHGDLDAALAGCTMVIGMTARARTLGWPELTPRQCARRAAEHSLAGEVALVFGRERSGLTNEQIDRCHYTVTIPSNAEYPSLNLVCAVQILTYELFMAGVAPGNEPAGAGEIPATSEELTRLHEHLREVLTEIGFLRPENPRILMRKIVRMLNRARLSQEEVNILRGVLTAVGNHRGST
jgi:tRNA/rRNA methyltransferase/tRNA (cytidine32/uridine32-2'-O)-methyltransferase